MNGENEENASIYVLKNDVLQDEQLFQYFGDLSHDFF